MSHGYWIAVLGRLARKALADNEGAEAGVRIYTVHNGDGVDGEHHLLISAKYDGGRARPVPPRETA